MGDITDTARDNELTQLAATLYRNLTRAQLTEQSLAHKDEQTELASNGALSASTGKRTGRSPKDRFIVKDNLTAQHIDWGNVNQPIEEATFNALWDEAKAFMKGRDMFVADLQVGADSKHGIPSDRLQSIGLAKFIC